MPKGKAKPPRPSETSVEFVTEISRLLSDTKCSNVRLLDVRGISPVCDYLILGTGTSGRQMKSVADDVIELAEEQGHSVFSQSGGAVGDNWIAIDLVDVVVHLFNYESRGFYDLDGLWADAEEIHWARA